jgi:arabinofuranosyltransferase
MALETEPAVSLSSAAAIRSRLSAWVEAHATTKWPVRLGLVLVLLLAAVRIALLYRVTQGWMVDDAFIVFRYADQWVSGNGLVFNPGERVEGYTCFLWVALLAGLHRLGADLIPAARAAGIALTLGAIGFTYLLGIRRIGRRLGWLPALLIACNHSILSWSFGGLEVPLFLFLLVLGAYLLFVTETPWFLLAFSGAALTRPDGHLFVILGAIFLLHVFRDRPLRQRVVVLGAALLPLFAMEAFRVGYYHAVVPNTFHAKVGLGTTQLRRGFDYLNGAASAYCVLLPGALLLWLRRGPLDSYRAFLLAFTAGYGAFVIYAGGDPLPGYRFALPLLVLAWLALATLIADAEKLGAAAAFVAILLASDVSEERATRVVFKHFRDDKVGVCGEHIGRWLDEHARPGALVATNTGGSIPYFARRQRALDMLGLTNAHIARAPRAVGHGFVGHEKFDPKYVFAEKPDYIFLCFSCNTSGPCVGGDKELVRIPGFDAAYRRRDAVHQGFRFSFYERRSNDERR